MPDALAFDIGGTKTLAALVRGAEVIAEAQVPTPRGAGPDAWLDAAAEAARPWAGRFDRAGAAVTGAVDGGLWRALNPGILPVPDGFPIEAALAARLGVPVIPTVAVRRRGLDALGRELVDHLPSPQPLSPAGRKAFVPLPPGERDRRAAAGRGQRTAPSCRPPPAPRPPR